MALTTAQRRPPPCHQRTLNYEEPDSRPGGWTPRRAGVSAPAPCVHPPYRALRCSAGRRRRLDICRRQLGARRRSDLAAVMQYFIAGACPILWATSMERMHGVQSAAGLAMINTIGFLGGFFGPYLSAPQKPERVIPDRRSYYSPSARCSHSSSPASWAS